MAIMALNTLWFKLEKQAYLYVLVCIWHLLSNIQHIYKSTNYEVAIINITEHSHKIIKCSLYNSAARFTDKFTDQPEYSTKCKKTCYVAINL